ncbi:Ig-like domain-containing protein [Leucobacter sp. wl10]|uniref:Ig-like domain-containing protein n=1 Tax=Leucobacter sp. wl10 TaxID=2304677 RepID=UPI001F095C38|nr:Ig-like domain-containing protein [Leucobacter sp. wl10]
MARPGGARGAAARRQAGARRRRTRAITWVSGVAALAMIATIAVVAAGYDARETPREEPSVWAVRSSGQYARVNTLTGEIDTVRRVEEPSGLLQSGSRGVVLSHGNGRAWGIDPALPRDLVEEPEEPGEPGSPDGGDAAPARAAAGAAAEGSPGDAMRLPDGTRDTIVAGDTVLMRTENGDVYLSGFAGGADGGDGASAQLTEPRLLDPFADDRAGREAGAGDPRRFVATAAAVDAEGTVALFSADDQEVRWYSADRGAFTGVARVPERVTDENAQLAVVAGKWVIFEPAAGLLWREGSADPVAVETTGDARLQASSPESTGDAVLLADGAGLWELRDGEVRRIAEAEGVPAQPAAVGEERYAAWLGQTGAQLWSAGGGVRQLELDGSVDMPGDPEPVIRSNGTSALLSEVGTGMLWTVPDGKLIPVEQWSLVDPPKERDGTVVVSDVTKQEPPVAVDDAFGVRPGEPAQLPVLLNDYDPNRRDVLTIVPDGLGDGLPPEFGAVSVLPDGQALVIQPAAGASGTSRFTYRITDGVTVSEAATVTLRAVDPGENSAPQWCPVEGCQRDWPSPELVPGGTLVLPVLEGWVDAEGDPMMLAAAAPANPDDPVRALITADGRLALRHVDPNAPDGDIAVRVRVADSRGESTERELTVQIRRGAQAVLSAIAATADAGRPTVVRPLSRIVGGSGSYALVDATVQSGKAEATVSAASGTVEVRSAEAGTSVISITARDTGTDTEIDGVLRVTAFEAAPRLALPPMRAFVRPLADTTVDVLDAVPGANGRELVVRGAEVVDGELRADVVEHARVRVSGSTADGAPGRIGAVDVRVGEGEQAATGRLTVFQVPESGAAGAIAVADNLTVRAGAVADIPVLDNDVSPPGQRLVLNPEVGGSGAKGELAFASGNVLRYLAPSEPGTYTLSYTAYGASSPEASDVGLVRVTVLPRDGNREPQPEPLTVRLAPGERASVSVPLSGADPDGDRVRLVGVGASDDAQVSATLAPRSSAIRVAASRQAETGVRLLSYSVRDEFGGEAEGSLRVIVTDPDPGAGAPITYSDYVRTVQNSGDPAAVRPLDNDIDPANGRLELVEVVPNVPGGAESAQYRRLVDRLDLSQMRQGRVTVRSGSDLGTVSYRYTARSPQSKSTAEGLIVVQVSARVGQQAPAVQDTVLSARDRTELEQGGIDVVTDRVQWNAGDTRTLQLSVWGRASERFTVSGTRISGAYRAEGDLVPFRLAGTDLTGKKVETFGFLVIPPLDELRLTLVPGLAPLRVDEGGSIDVSLADVVDLAPGDDAELKVGRLPVQRGQARCEATSATGLRYSAGRGEPWADSCLVSVKLVEQRTWTRLALPVQIVPDEPVVELEPLTRTISPGNSETIDLLDMVRWQGGRAGDTGALSFRVSGGGASFEVSPAGSRLTVQARADAVPGGQDALTVSVTGSGEGQALLTLRVGQAARDAPRGATVQLNCTVGSDCRTQVIGAEGEYDPFAGRSGGGLTLVSVDGNSCAYGSLRAEGGSVRVAWPDGAGGSGGRCTAAYTVRDAQGRTGTGVIELDARGLPRAPVGVTPVSADASSVTLSVALSAEASYPAVSGVELVSGGRAVGSCALAGGQASCTLAGLAPGERRTYTARAVNAVGVSETNANGAETWAYVPPPAPSLSATTVKWPDNTRPDLGRVEVRIGESDAAARVLSIDGAETRIDPDGVYEVAAGRSLDVSVVAADSADMIPPGYSGSDGGRGAARTVSVTPIGAPIAGGATLTLSGPAETDWSIGVAGWGRNGGDELRYLYGLEQQKTAPGCGDKPSSGSGLAPFRYYTGSACASNSYGRTAAVGTGTVFTGGIVPPPAEVNYSISSTPSPSTTSSSVLYGAVAPDEADMTTVEGGSIVWDVPVSSVTPGDPDAKARQCVDEGKRCSVPVTIGPPNGVTPFTVAWNGACIDPASDPSGWGSFFVIDGSPGAIPSFARSGATRDVAMSWPGAPYQPAIFTGLLCEPPPESGPAP